MKVVQIKKKMEQSFLVLYFAKLFFIFYRIVITINFIVYVAHKET